MPWGRPGAVPGFEHQRPARRFDRRRVAVGFKGDLAVGIERHRQSRTAGEIVFGQGPQVWPLQFKRFGNGLSAPRVRAVWLSMGPPRRS